MSSLFVSTLVDTRSPVAQINFQKAKQKSLASVYVNREGEVVQAYIIFNEEFEKMKEIHFADFVTANFDFKNLLIFTSIARGMLEKDDGATLKVNLIINLVFADFMGLRSAWSIIQPRNLRARS